MTPLSIIGALSALPLARAHMQMSSPSPLRDPHATDRPNEPKDYNILSPLNADGSNFACKGYHLNTPLTTVATYEAGSQQTLRLSGSATHGGGSCQISMSCDGGNDFRVMKSIIGDCPMSDSYKFTVPGDMPAAKKCLLAWTWFNRIGNREMYMNCAVVDITNKRKSKRDTQASAVTALSKFPELFVANLADINSCKIQETTNAIFDDPGKDISYGGGDSSSLKSPFAKGQCTGKPSKNAGSKDTSSSNSGGGGQWTAPAKTSTKPGGCAAKIASGEWHPECSGSQSQGMQQQQPTQQQPSPQEQASKQYQQSQKPEQDAQKKVSKGKPNTRVQQELDAYLATLYGHARRDTWPAAKYLAPHDQENKHAVKLHAHVHTKDYKHNTDSYPPSFHYHSEDSKGGIDFSNKNAYSTLQSQDHQHPSSAYKRVSRQERWTSYNKRAEVSDTVNEVPAEASPQASTQTPTETAVQTPSAVPAQRSYIYMTDANKLNAYLQRMVELSNNLASLIKYAAASSVRVPYYPSRNSAPVTTPFAEGTVVESDQNTAAVPRFAKRGDFAYSASTFQPGPGPSINNINAAGDATDAGDGFMGWFPNLVQGSLAKRQLVDLVTSPASAESGDSINFFDMLMAGLWKLFGNPFNIYGDEPDTSVAHSPSEIPLVLGEPVLPSGPPFIPDFDIPDLDGGYTFPPQIPAPELPAPELVDPLADDSSTDLPTIIISIDPVDSTGDIFPGLDVPALTPCVQPIPHIGFNSCWGGCNHTAEETAQHEVYLQNFAEEEAAYEECLNNPPTNSSSPPSNGTLYEPDDGENDAWQSNPEEASGRKPRPGMSLPLIPSPLPVNYTLPSPLNTTEAHSNTTDATSLPLNATEPASNDTATLPLLPYQNKTLGELVDAILNDPAMLEAPEPVVVGDAGAEVSPALTPVPSDSSDDAPPVDAPTETNPLQEAADQAEEGATAPQESVAVKPNPLLTIADALPWLMMGPGPVVTSGVSEGVGEPPL